MNARPYFDRSAAHLANAQAGGGGDWTDPRLGGDASAAPPPLTLVRELPRRVETFATLAALAERLLDLRGRQGLVLERSRGGFSGGAEYEACSVSVRPPGQESWDWLGSVAIPHADIPALQAALKTAAAARRAPARKAAA